MKHAVLIMAHAQFGQLRRLVKALDHEDVDIFVHINRRSADWQPSQLEGATIHSHIFFVNRVNIYYCDYSQVEAQRELLSASTKRGYDYYHLLSGADLPIHPISQILKFFEENRGREFVGFDNKYIQQKAGLRFFFTNSIRTSSGIKQKILLHTQKMMLRAQKLLGVNYARKFEGEIKKGCDWWSISHRAALTVLEREPEFRRYFQHTYCPSELLMQTILYNSPLRDQLFKAENESQASMREIDWHRGTPYVWRSDDFEYLINSECMFARKFDPNVDNEIITKIINHISKK